jgi:TatD family-associated radical SAM protein
MYDPPMDIAYRFGDPSKLYLNVTNRCTNRCGFCIRYHADGVGGSNLWGGSEPDLDTLLTAVEAMRGPEPFREVTWCGFGEPTYRLDLITAAAPYLRGASRSIRLNTNGHACLIHGRDVLGELAAAVDDVSVSLNAPNRRRYLELCRPDSESVAATGSGAPEGQPVPEGSSANAGQATIAVTPGDPGRESAPRDFWEAVLDFLTRSPGRFRSVQASVVGAVLSAEEIGASRELARSLGVELFRVR